MELFWETKQWEQGDRHLTALQAMPFHRPFPSLSLKQGLYQIRGPRQIGKTSWMKQLLSHQAKDMARKCFYLSCENLRDHLDLADVLKSVRNRKWIFLDEITFVDEWARAVKHEVDSGHLHTLVITGSNAVDLRKGGERLPGRWGEGTELTLLPMLFDEFCKMRAQAGWTGDERLELLRMYFRVGGFPIAVAEAGREGNPPVRAMKTYQRWLLGDFTRLGKQELYLKELLLHVGLTLMTPISLQSLASRTQMGSHHTAQEYVAILEDCFALRTLYAMNPNTGSYSFRKNKKFYFVDPMLFWMALDWTDYEIPNDWEHRLAEMVAHEQLARLTNRFGYLSSQAGEVDFYKKGKWAIEVKWTQEIHNISKAYRSLRVPEKMVWTQTNYLENLPHE